MANPDDDGLAKIGNAYFMVRSPNEALHAVNPKNKKTYCGHDMLKLWNVWRPIDQLPDDKLCNLAISKGFRLQYSVGLTDKYGNVVAGVTEEEVFAALGLPYVEPKDREV